MRRSNSARMDFSELFVPNQTRPRRRCPRSPNIEEFITSNLFDFDASNLLIPISPPPERKRKRQSSPLEDFQCPICRRTLKNPMSPSCGHTFCETCIEKTIRLTGKCPTCRKHIGKDEKMIERPEMKKLADENRLDFDLKRFLKTRGYEETCEKLDVIMAHFGRIHPEFENSRTVLQKLKKRLEMGKEREDSLKKLMLHEFMKMFSEKRLEEAKIILDEHNFVVKDYLLLTFLQQKNDWNSSLAASEASEFAAKIISPKIEPKCQNSHLDVEHTSILQKHYNCLAEEYLKRKNHALESNADRLCTNLYNSTQKMVLPKGRVDLDDFSSVLSGMCKYSSMKNIGTMAYNNDLTSSVVSAIEFDKDGEYFVIAGIANKMKFYDFDKVIDRPESACAIKTIDAGYKISNVCWNPFAKQVLANSDYVGNLHVWDAARGIRVHQFKEHERRCWSVQFSNVDPTMMASGSDDMKVKLWQVINAHSTATIDAKVQVCCVHFNPIKVHELVFGGSDHFVYVYDIRNLSGPTKKLNGHKKAVSYIKFMDGRHVVSASTDSTLRVWDLMDYDNPEQTVMTGHVNEKNFVGLATNGEHIVCGSETNEVYTYYKRCRQPICSYDFSADSLEEMSQGVLSFTRSVPEFPQSEFVSALCWKKESNIVMAANSLGKAHILQLFPLKT